MPDLKWNDRWDREASLYLEGDGVAKGLGTYGYQWGDPEAAAYSGSVLKSDFIDPFPPDGEVIVEIGPGGGRFTQYLLNASRLYLVDYNARMFEVIKHRFTPPEIDKCTFIHSAGSDLDGVPDSTVDKVFTFDCFVHLEPNLIEGYVAEIARVLKHNGMAVLHFADSNKPLAQKLIEDGFFADMTPDDMQGIVQRHGFRVFKEDRDSISHSAVFAIAR